MRILLSTPLLPFSGMALSASKGIGGSSTPRAIPTIPAMDPLSALTECHNAAAALQACAARFSDSLKTVEHAIMATTAANAHEAKQAAALPRIDTTPAYSNEGMDLKVRDIISALIAVKEPLAYLDRFFTAFLEGIETPHTMALRQVRLAIASALSVLGFNEMAIEPPAQEPDAKTTATSIEPPSAKPTAGDAETFFELHSSEGLTDKGNKRRLNDALFITRGKKIDWSGAHWQDVTHGDVRAMLDQLERATAGKERFEAVTEDISPVRELLQDDKTSLHIMRTTLKQKHDSDEARLCRALLELFRHRELTGGKLKRLLKTG